MFFVYPPCTIFSRSDELTVGVLSCLENLVEIDLSLLEHQLEEIIKGLLTSGETSEVRSCIHISLNI